MRINKLNYEVYAIDYIDGNLPDDLKAEMEQFLLIHPDIAKDVALFGEMTFVPDQSVKYMRKQDLKKPMQFAISDYMHWIVPVCMSVAFMVAYPYIRPLWHTDKTEKEPVQDEIKQEASIEKATQTISLSENLSGNVSQNDVASNNSTIAFVNNASSSQTSSESNINFYASKKNPIVASSNLERENNSLEEEVQLSNSLASEHYQNDIESHSKETYEGQSIVDFGYNVVEEEEVVFLNSRIDELDIERNIDTKFLDELIRRKSQKLGYVTFTLQPLSIGYDMAKTTNILSTNQLVRDLPVQGIGENGSIAVGEPVQVGVEVDYHVSDLIKFGLGLRVTNRNISYQPLNSAGNSLDIQYRTYSVPATATFKMPMGRNANSLQMTGGIAMNWMGERNYEVNNQLGGVTSEKSGTASLFNSGGNTKMVTTNDVFRMLPSIQFGVAYYKDLRQYGGLTFGIEYGRQMENINTIRLYDYDADTQFRSNETSYNMRFETVNATIKYTLPYHWQLRKKQFKN